MALRSILLTAVIFLLVALGIYKFYTLFHRPLVHHLNADLELIGFIGNDDTHNITPHSVLNGEDSVLVYDHAEQLYQEILQKIPQAKYLTTEEIFNVNNFHLLDKDNNHLLTAEDPIFKHLFIIDFTDNGKQNDIKSLAGAGIKSISLNMTPSGTYKVLMADGTLRTLYSFSKTEKLNLHE